MIRTKLKVGAVTAAILAVGGYIILDRQQANRLSEEVASLREQLAAVQDENQRLVEQLNAVTERSQAQASELAQLRAQAATFRRMEQENARLRAERDRQQRQAPDLQGADASSGRALPAQDAVTTNAAGVDLNMVRNVALAATRGEPGAIDELEKIKQKLYVNIDYEKDPARVAANLVLMRAAFDVLGNEAGNGNAAAFQALYYATGKSELRPFTADAFGTAAAQGNEDALEVLLGYKKYGLLLSSVVPAMTKSAEKSNPRAVEFLVDVLNDPKHKPLWRMASQGLVSAANLGNQNAVAALEKYHQNR
jgi:hypothetical protein